MAAIENLITKNMDVWTSAIKQRATQGRGSSKKQELYGIQKLRELIVDFAVRGLLVPQNLNDEPAALLLDKIAAEKAHLVKAKKKKQPSLPDISDDEIPFDLPKNWIWTRLGDLSSNIHYGYTASAQPETAGIRLLRITDIQKDKVNWQTVPGCEITKDKAQGYLLENDDILIARTGGTIGKSYLVENIEVEAVFASYLIRVKRIAEMYSAYIKTYLGSSIYWRQLYDSASGTGQPNVNATALKGLLVPIAPIEEQKRIVAKVDELMALCDQLEEQQENSLAAHQQLVEVLLTALTQAADAEAFQQAWTRLAANFETLFTTENSIDQLKQTLLQLAVMGKLVPQDPNDESALKLLEKIGVEKERLIKEKVIKNQKKLPVINDEEIPFPAPVGWSFLRLGDYSYVFSGNSFKSGEFNQLSGTKVIKITNAGVGELVETNDFLPEDFSEKYQSYKVFEGDLILALTRPFISAGLKVSICPPSYDGSLLNQRVASIRPFSNIQFLYQYMQSIYVLGFYKKRFGGSGLQPNLKMSDVTELVIPVPPIEEQQRIVAKVDQLFAICDQLKAKIRTAQTTQLQLADALTSQAVQ